MRESGSGSKRLGKCKSRQAKPVNLRPPCLHGIKSLSLHPSWVRRREKEKGKKKGKIDRGFVLRSDHFLFFRADFCAPLSELVWLWLCCAELLIHHSKLLAFTPCRRDPDPRRMCGGVHRSKHPARQSDSSRRRRRRDRKGHTPCLYRVFRH